MKFFRISPILVALFALVTLAQAAPAGDLTIRFTAQQTVDGENALGVTFSSPLDPSQALDPYFTITQDQGEEGFAPVSGGWILSQDLSTAYFTHVTPRTRYRIQVKKGLKAQSGSWLAQDAEFEVRTRPAEPMIRFNTQGFILPDRLTRGLPVTSMNIPRADIDFFRIKPGKLAEFRELTASNDDQLYYYQAEELNQMADLVYTGRWDLEKKKDLRVQATLPITHIPELKAPGIYIAVLRGAGQYQYNYSRTWFTISDLGLHLRKYAESMTLWTQSLESAGPRADVTVTGYNHQGKPLFEVHTNTQGRAHIQGQYPGLKTVIAQQGDQITLLPVDRPALDLSEFKTAKLADQPLTFFVFGPRNLYRPGETVITQGLLRDRDGRPVSPLPVRAQIFQPDGRQAHEFIWKPGKDNSYRDAYTLDGTAPTGNWRIRYSQADIPLAEYPFIVSDFMPERLALELTNSPGQLDILSTDETLVLALEGRFLYGAPAAKIPADALIRVKPARELFPDRWPGYEFGSPDRGPDFSFSTDRVRLDAQGKALLTVENQWREDTDTPLWITANASLHDTSGRPVTRKKTWQVWPAPELVGIRALAQDGQVNAEGLAEFDVIRLNPDGQLRPFDGLQVRVIREHREYYWENRNGSWEWGFTPHRYPMDKFSLDLNDQGPSRISFPVESGRYILEITDPATRQLTTREIWAGWRPDNGESQALNRPDRVDISLDKAAYRSGETVRATLKSPEGGKGVLMVEGDRLLFSTPVTLPPEGATFDIPVKPEWQRHDLYISALIVRPGQAKTARLPKRSLGLVHLPLDRESRRLALEIQVPDKVESGRRLSVPVTLRRADGSIPENARVFLAAVDEGILSLTRFKSPSAFDHFFQPRRFGVEPMDIYQKLIESGEGALARHRFGGDAPGLARGGDRPATDVRIIALAPQPRSVDAQGLAQFDLDLPEFNGRLRLMALAWTPEDFGNTDQGLTLASPLVTQMALPRFLATGDTGRLVLDLHNLSGLAQEIKIHLKLDGPLALDTAAQQNIHLAVNEKRSLILPVKAGEQAGRTQIQLNLTGLKVQGKARSLQRQWFLETRPPYPAQTRVMRRALEPGKTFTLKAADLAGLIPATRQAELTLDTTPPLNLATHVRELKAYPYGCLEQTISGLFPHLILSDADLARLGIAPDPQAPDKIRLGIQRILKKQKAGGGFGLWDADSPEEPWLTAYAAHFLVEAVRAGYTLPAKPVKSALKRLLTYVRRPRSIPAPRNHREGLRAAVRAYAAFVLAQTQNLTLGDARSTARAITPQIKSRLPHVHLGLALTRAGDPTAGRTALEKARITQRDKAHRYLGDYGSRLRDTAMAYALAADDASQSSDFLSDLNERLAEREWLSTQERNALVMAGAAKLKAPQAPWTARLTVDNKAKTTQELGRDGQNQLTLAGAQLGQGLTLKNTGDRRLYLNLTLGGYPNTAPAPITETVAVSRQFMDLNGRPLEPGKALAPGQRILVGLTLKAKAHMPHALVVDLIPAGLELSDPRLATSPAIEDITVAKKTIAQWQAPRYGFRLAHTEYRDDRFVAAVALNRDTQARLFYAAVAVTPGKFIVPPPLVEDMYLPELRGLGAGRAPLVIDAP